jgi:hypothetical protein
VSWPCEERSAKGAPWHVATPLQPSALPYQLARWGGIFVRREGRNMPFNLTVSVLIPACSMDARSNGPDHVRQSYRRMSGALKCIWSIVDKPRTLHHALEVCTPREGRGALFSPALWEGGLGSHTERVMSRYVRALGNHRGSRSSIRLRSQLIYALSEAFSTQRTTHQNSFSGFWTF